MSDMLFGGPTEPPEDRTRAPSNMRVLITVKAAPNPSATYGETVCVAGLRLDLGHEGWDLTFRKYDVVTLSATPASEGRYESWRPRIDTLHVEAHLDGWSKRMPHLGPFAHATMCDLNKRALKGGPSLGLVRAARVVDLQIAAHPGWTDDEKQKISDYINQPELFDSGRPKAALEAPRYVATYRWHCPEPDCKGHQQQLLDWEFSAYQRRLPADDGAARAAIRQRWLTELCSLERQVYFYVGNQAKRHQTFSILGLVYPKR